MITFNDALAPGAGRSNKKKMSVREVVETIIPMPEAWGGDLTARAITGSGGNSRDLTAGTKPNSRLQR